MSTHATTIVLNDDSTELANIYTHFDGYPSYHGRVLKKFLVGSQDRNREAPKYVEDATHLGLLLIAHLAASADRHRVHRLAPIGSREEYTYIVSMPHGKGVQLKVRYDGHLLYEGPVDDFDPKRQER